MDKYYLILDRLILLSKETDIEDAHSKADNLLCEALMASSEEKWSKTQCNAIVVTYEQIQKYYA